MNHRVTHGREPLALPKNLPVIVVELLVHPLKGNVEAMRKTSKMVFNIWDPPLLASVQINADEFVWEFNMPCISHQPLFLSSGLIVVLTNNLLSLLLLTILNMLFPFICIE